MELKIDFKILDTYEKLNKYLADKLNLAKYIQGEYGYNLQAFRDTYEYGDEKDIFILTNIDFIKDEFYKENIKAFIEILERLKKTNKNFDYEIKET